MEKDDKSLRPVFTRASNDNKGPSDISEEGLRRALNPPHDNTQEVLHGVTVKDPFRPLENLDAPDTVAWAARQNQQFEDYIKGSDASMASATEFLTKALDYDRASLPARYGDKYFRTFQKALAPQGVVQVASSANGPWDTILDPNMLKADGTIALSGWTPSKDGKRIAYLTSEAGSDEQTLYIYDVEKQQTLPDTVTKARFTAVLWDRDSHDSFQYTYPRHDDTHRTFIKHHAIGETQEQDKTIFDARPEASSLISPGRMHTAKYEWISTAIGTDKNRGLMFRPYGSNEEFKVLLEPRKTTISPIAELEDGSILAVTTKDAPHGRLVQFDPRDPAEEKWKTIIPESKDDLLNNVLLHKGKLFAFYSHDTADAVRVFTPEGQHLHDIPLPVQSVIGLARVNEDDDTFLLRISGFTSPGDTYSYDIAKNSLTLVEKTAAPFDLNEAIVERLYATSKDGTQVPYTVIRLPETELDGTAATKLYGYGGFNIPLGPVYSNGIAHFVKSGGIYVQANLRGGGEFGTDWHNGGRGANKQNVFDDFAAVAEDLAARKYTSAQRLVINGGSNGGLLTAATMLQRPELFGAVITEVGVEDMFRFHLATYGAAWKSDYGDPGIKEDFNVAAKYSPLHNVKPGAKYPPHLIKTADHDDRVVPWHSFKLAATLQALSHEDNTTLLRVEGRAGHGAGKPTAKIIQAYAESFAFIEKSIGPVDQKAYKAKLATEKKPDSPAADKKFKAG
ncbi:MAG: S9 family peptidase [Proteobacteria bacterium]|nr:S9 family peptidase [Pseudomonadota bacterium]